MGMNGGDRRASGSEGVTPHWHDTVLQQPQEDQRQQRILENAEVTRQHQPLYQQLPQATLGSENGTYLSQVTLGQESSPYHSRQNGHLYQEWSPRT